MRINRQNLPLNGLRTFEVVARERNMTSAAEELNITHSAVSQQIRKLEDALATKLFDRRRKPLGLTAKGEELLASVSKGLDILTRGTEETCSGEIEGELEICCIPGLGSNWFVPVLGEFLSTYDKVRVQVSTDHWHHPTQLKKVDLALSYVY